MFAKLDVNGEAAAPLYQWLCDELADDEGKPVACTHLELPTIKPVSILATAA